MNKETRKSASFRQWEREELFSEVKLMMKKVEADMGVSLFPITLRQMGLFLRYVRATHREAGRLVKDLQKSLTYYQGRRIMGTQADPSLQNWKTHPGRIAADILNKLGLY